MLLEFRIEQTITIDLERVYLNIESLFFFKDFIFDWNELNPNFWQGAKKNAELLPQKLQEINYIDQIFMRQYLCHPSLLH